MGPVRATKPLPFKLSLFRFILISWIGGTLVYLLQKCFSTGAETNLTSPLFQSNTLALHNASAFAMMVAYGYLIASHFRDNWKEKQQRRLCIILMIAQLAIIIGYVIYRVDRQSSFTTSATIHFILSSSFPLLLISHLYLATKKIRSTK